VLWDADQNPVSSTILRTELMKNRVCAGRRLFLEPRWLGSREHLADKHHASVVFSFYDPDGDGFELMKRSPPYLFGRMTTVRAFENRPTLLQCGRCLRLGHTIPNCKRSKTFLACAKCGGPHLTSIHKYHCNVRGAKHKGAHCDCPPSCFLCLEKRLPGKDHIATDESCPLRKHFRSSLRAAITATVAPTPNPLPKTPAPSTPSSWSPTPPPTTRIDDPAAMTDITPSPAAQGPFTLANIPPHLADVPPQGNEPARLQFITHKHHEGLSLSEIGKLFHDRDKLDFVPTAGPVPNV
jgi:hypothetical protein